MVWLWTGFILFILLMLALDLGVIHREAHVIGLREALVWSGIWIAMGLSFSIFVYFAYEGGWFGLGATVDAVDGRALDGTSATLKYLTGYVIEKSLSVDNIFVMAMIFGFLGVPALYQHRVLFWGIIGALVLRGILIVLGAQLIATYHWIIYVFGVFLLVTAVKMLVVEENDDPAQSLAIRLLKKVVPVTDRFHGSNFFVRAGSPQADLPPSPGEEARPDPTVDAAEIGTLMVTPLGVALVLVETTDLIFAVDSIPAIFAITADPFLVFTSNVFALLGLRALYFALAGLIHRFRYLKLSLALVLAVVGLKMLFMEPLKEALGPGFNLYLLCLILLILAFGVLGSLWTGPRIDPTALLEKDDADAT